MSDLEDGAEKVQFPSWSEFFSDRPQDKLRVFDWSVSGFETCIVVHGQGFRLALDIGSCPHQAISAEHVFISHGHLDHCGALHQHMRRRQLVGLPPATYYVPEHLVQPLSDIVRLFGAVHGDADDGDSEGGGGSGSRAKVRSKTGERQGKAKDAKASASSAPLDRTGNEDTSATGISAIKHDKDATGSSAVKDDKDATGSSAVKDDKDATGSSAIKDDKDATGSSAVKDDKDATGSSTVKDGKDATGSSIKLHGKIVAAIPGEDLPLSKNLRLRTFATDHRVPSIGCVLYSRRSYLLPQFVGLSGPELGDLARNGEQLRESRWEATIGYTGDTRFSVLAHPPEPDLLSVKLLICELTYVEGPTDMAEKHGHCHLHDFSARSNLFSSVGQLFFVHFSRRYAPDRVLKAVLTSVPEELRSRVYCGLNALRFYQAK